MTGLSVKIRGADAGAEYGLWNALQSLACVYFVL